MDKTDILRQLERVSETFPRAAVEAAVAQREEITPDLLRILEDPLRILRGLQMISRFSLKPTEETKESMEANAAALAHIPGERKMAEMDKLLGGENRREAVA